MIRDIIKAILVAAACSVVFCLVLFLGGLLFGAAGVMSGLEVMKDGMFLLTAVMLFLLAGMIMLKGKKPQEEPADNGWKKQFQVLNIKAVIFIFAVVVLLFAALADYMMLLIK